MNTVATYNETVAKRLTEVYHTSSLQEGRELSDLRLILFSDLHKGQRDGADDFKQCEQTYRAALEYYWQGDYELLLLGDIEELWECWPSPVIKAYSAVLEEERAFAEAQMPSRFMRFVGNHDDLWYDARQVEHHLGPYLAGKKVIEAMRLQIHDEGQPLGELFFVHGHQGSPDSDRFAGLSSLVVRYIWRPIQRIFNYRSSTPSNNFELRQKHEQAMYAYAENQPGLVLIAGHTHHPVWEGLGFEQAMQQRMQLEGEPPPTDPQWMQVEAEQAVTLAGAKPCYFNTGCCSYSDGSITGIEIEGGEIRLVRWITPGEPPRHVLFVAGLADVLRAVAG